ncbi:MAG: hypothetical protein JW776_04925 [Candidatus Lokiarchaeota archaeon]|nr:hypothetical protein [Candidatus Lokiarchaeota archaeon]
MVSQDQTFGKYLEKFPEKIRKIALSLRVMILKIIPNAQEKVHIGMKWITYGIPRSIIAIKPEYDHIKLFFFEGTRLMDPSNLLKGSGTRLRFVPISTLANMKEDLNLLIEQVSDVQKKRTFRKRKI